MDTESEPLEAIRAILKEKKVRWEEKHMFGGLCFMVDDKMCFGTYKGGLMARVDPEQSEALIKRKGATLMIHGGRTMNGFLSLAPAAYAGAKNLRFWMEQCLEYNPRAASSKKKGGSKAKTRKVVKKESAKKN